MCVLNDSVAHCIMNGFWAGGRYVDECWWFWEAG